MKQHSQNEKFALALIVDAVLLGFALFLSGSVQTIGGGNDAIRYGPGTTTVYPNGTETSYSVNQIVPMSVTEVDGLWLIFGGIVLVIDYFIFTIDKMVASITKPIRAYVTTPLTPEEIANRTEWFRLQLQARSEELKNRAKE